MLTPDRTLVGEDSVFRLADQYFDRLGLDWRRRARMLDSRTLDFAALAGADARMEAQIEAFIHLGEPCAQRTLKQLHEPLAARDLFVATIQAVVAREPDLFAACMAIAGALPGMRQAFLQAADWCAAISPQDTTAAWRRLKEDGAIADVQLLFALASLRTPTLGADAPQWAAPLLKAASERPPLLAPALDLARLHRWPHWDMHAQTALAHADAEVRAAAVRHLLIAGSSEQQRQAFQVGAAIVTQPGPWGEALIGPLMLAPQERVVAVLRTLRDTPSLRSRYIDALAWHGDAQAVELLRPLLRLPAEARRAAAAISVLTGSNPGQDHWQALAPDKPATTDAALPAPDPEHGWPWPDANAFDHWWADKREHFAGQPQWLLGQVPTRASLLHHLHHAPLCWRPMAAWRLQHLSPDCALATDLPAGVQRALLCQIAESIHGRT